MRDRFKWYLGPDAEELQSIWDAGILTVDANVLLDTYRYHQKTRREIQRAIDSFGQRVWLSAQAADEFFSNRKGVISSSETTFREAEKALQNLAKTVEGAVGSLRSHRLVPRDSLDRMGRQIAEAISEAETKVGEARDKHPNYLADDPILDWILKRFDGRLGDAPTADDLVGLHKEGEERRRAKTPPGYLDADKDGVRPYGDFLLWRQTLLHAKAVGLPIILVTSERKPDWWEEINGKTVGPRVELMREAVEFSGQRVLIYQTEYFLRLAAERAGVKVDEAVEEIRHVGDRRTTIESAIAVTQLPVSEDRYGLGGLLEVQVLRPVHNFTCTARPDSFYENWREGEVRVEMASHPPSTPKMTVKGRIGQFGDLNVHCHSVERAEDLPTGRYVFEYRVTLPNSTLRSGSDGHACLQCGRTDAWNGVRCLACGFVNDD